MIHPAWLLALILGILIIVPLAILWFHDLKSLRRPWPTEKRRRHG